MNALTLWFCTCFKTAAASSVLSEPEPAQGSIKIEYNPLLGDRGSRTRKSCALCYVKDRMIDDVSRLHSPSYFNGTSRPARRHRRAHPDPLQSRPRRQRNQIQARLIFFSSAPDKLIHTSSSVQRSLLTSVYPTDQMSISSLLPSSLIARTPSKW